MLPMQILSSAWDSLARVSIVLHWYIQDRLANHVSEKTLTNLYVHTSWLVCALLTFLMQWNPTACAKISMWGSTKPFQFMCCRFVTNDYKQNHSYESTYFLIRICGEYMWQDPYHQDKIVSISWCHSSMNEVSYLQLVRESIVVHLLFAPLA